MIKSLQSPILDFSLSNPNKGMLFDVRDGQSYQVVKIGNQIWTAENFRYLPSIKEKGDKYENSWVYENNTDYLDLHYGRLYDWNTANNIAPEGWKLPSDEDFMELKDFIIKDNNLYNSKGKVGSYLKSLDGWISYENIVNNDKYGFNAKPAGCYGNNRFYNAGYDINFGSATKYNNSDNVSCWNLYFSHEGFSSHNCYNDNRLSVRLIKTK